jgi:hypothetical protein
MVSSNGVLWPALTKFSSARKKSGKKNASIGGMRLEKVHARSGVRQDGKPVDAETLRMLPDIC